MLQEMQFQELVERYIEIKDTIDALEVERKDVASDIEAALAVAGQKRVRYSDHFCVEACNGGTGSKIDAKLLASKGVAADVINECTIPGKKYTYVQIVDLNKQKGGPVPDAVAE